jgi:peptidoglycan/LPS O-acetylase OafA/YrhL
MRVVSLDALRGVAALTVAVPHYLVAHDVHPVFFQAVSILSVEVFFVLSGFVLAPQINYCLQGGSTKNLLVFYLRRWMRTLPPYVIALCLVAMLTANLFTPQFLRYLFFVQNIASIDAANDFFPIAWSLSVEEWFYVLFPLFLLALGRIGCGAVRAGIIFIAAFFALKLVGATLVPDWDAVARRLVLFRLDAIAFGFLLYFLIKKVPSFTSRGAVPLHFAFFVMAGVAMAVTMAIISSNENTTIRLIFFYLGPLFGGSLIAILYATNGAFLKLRIVERLSTFFGSISYDVYLFHLPVMFVLDRILAPSVAMFVFYISGVIVVSYLMRLMIENRILAARPGYARFSGTGFLGPSDQIEESGRSSQSPSEVG